MNRLPSHFRFSAPFIYFFKLCGVALVWLLGTNSAFAGYDEYVTGIAFVIGDEQSSDPCPRTYGSEWEWDLNSTNPFSSTHVYLCKRFQPVYSAPAVKAVQIVSYDARPANACPAGFVAAGYRYPGGSVGIDIADLNQGGGGKYVYLCYTTQGAPTDIFDLDIVSFSACEANFRKISGNLNAGRGFPSEPLDQALCIKNPFTRGWLHRCGGEGEKACEVTTMFFALNGSTCDNGLKENDQGMCVNHTRHDGAANDINGSWAHWALLHQINDLGQYSPHQALTYLGGHNAYNNRNDGFAFPNQLYSITQQLNAGMRVVDLDVYSGSDPSNTFPQLPRLCHVICSPYDRLLEGALKEIATWMRANPTQTIIILIEDYIGDTQRKKREMEYLIRYHLDTSDIGVVKTPQIANTQISPGGTDYINGLPTRSEMLKARTRVIVLAQRTQFSDIIHKKFSRFTHRLGGLEVQAFNTWPRCQEGTATSLPAHLRAHSRKMHEVLGDALPDGAERDLTPTDIFNLSECGVNIINFDNAIVTGGNRIGAAVWSWEEGDYGDKGDAVMMIGNTGRWRSRAHDTGILPFACQVDFDLFVTQASGPFSAGWSTCQTEFGPRAKFATPINHYYNRLLQDATNGQNVWLNYNDLLLEGKFVINEPVETRLTGSLHVEESASPVTYTFRIFGNNPQGITVTNPNCGRFGNLSPGTFQRTGNEVTFDCIFGSGANDLSRVSIDFTDPLGVEGQATAFVRVDNLQPRVESMSWSDNPVDEGSTTMLTVTFSDQGQDNHEVLVNQDIRESIPLGQRSVQVPISWRNGGNGISDIREYNNSIRIYDGTAFSYSQRIGIRVRNVAPVIGGIELTQGEQPFTDQAQPDEVITAVINYSDVGVEDTHRITIDWGDGTNSDEYRSLTPETQTQFQHTYNSAGDYSINVQIVDSDGGTTEQIIALAIDSDIAAALQAIAAQLDALPNKNRHTRRAQRFVKMAQRLTPYIDQAKWIKRTHRGLVKQAIRSLKGIKKKRRPAEVQEVIQALRGVVKKTR
ncbi:MAG: phosphatidylinositol-specific phospholipase C domain-containing protein [Pseudomonadota bacterium]